MNMNRTQTFLSSGYDDTVEIAARLVNEGVVESGTFIALYGGLGCGKTAFTGGIVQALCQKGGLPAFTAHSPTFTIVNEYPTCPPVFHFDMYRISSEDDLYQTGFYDYPDRNGIIIAEWSENIEYAVPKDAIRVNFEYGQNPNERKITIKF